jgi:hypothetical protein
MVAAITCSLCCNRSPSLEERIRATASRLKRWPVDNTIPKLYEQEVIDLAREPTGALDKAFRSLDAERSPGRGDRPPNDRVWLTGALITILAFDCPPVTSRDRPTWLLLKSKLTGDPSSFKRSPAGNKMLAEWPWSNDHRSWHLVSVDFIPWGSSDGRTAPLFEYYESHYKRRLLR